MLGRTHRFHGLKALNATYKHGRTVRAPMINLRYGTNNSGKPYRAAVVVSRKVNKSAVVRNRIRRRIYSAVREEGAGIKPGTDLIFTVFDDRLAGLRAEELQGTIAGLLDKTAR